MCFGVLDEPVRARVAAEAALGKLLQLAGLPQEKNQRAECSVDCFVLLVLCDFLEKVGKAKGTENRENRQQKIGRQKIEESLQKRRKRQKRRDQRNEKTGESGTISWRG